MLIKVKNYDEAIKQNDIILKSDPDDLNSLLFKARDYTYHNQYDYAQKIYQDLLLKHPDDCRVSYYTASSYFKNNMYNDASKYYERSINLAKKDGNINIQSFAHKYLSQIHKIKKTHKVSDSHS